VISDKHGNMTLNTTPTGHDRCCCMCEQILHKCHFVLGFWCCKSRSTRVHISVL